MITVCGRLTAECRWDALDAYPTEKACMMAGLAVDPRPYEFKCVPREKPRLPLPRPRQG